MNESPRYALRHKKGVYVEIVRVMRETEFQRKEKCVIVRAVGVPAKGRHSYMHVGVEWMERSENLVSKAAEVRDG